MLDPLMCTFVFILLFLPHGAMGWSTIYDCGISWSNSHVVFSISLFLQSGAKWAPRYLGCLFISISPFLKNYIILPRYEASTFTFLSLLCPCREQKIRLVKNINKNRQLCLHQGMQLVLQQFYNILKNRHLKGKFIACWVIFHVFFVGC